VLPLRPNRESSHRLRNRLSFNPRQPTRLSKYPFALHVLDLLKVDDAEQTAFVDFALWLSWEDADLRSPGAGDRFFRPNQIWLPNVQVVNPLSLTNRRVEVVEVDEQGRASYRKRLVGTISIPRDLTDFPIDTHVLQIKAVAAGMNRDVELIIDERLTGQSETFSVYPNGTWARVEPTFLSSPQRERAFRRSRTNSRSAGSSATISGRSSSRWLWSS
jgi:hypothetical protein